MTRSLRRLLPVAVVSILAVPAARAATVAWQNAGSHVGERIEVEGDVVAAYVAQNTCVLEFDSADDHALRVRLLLPVVSSLPPNPERLYIGKRIVVSGTVKRFLGKLEMVVNSPNAIEVMGVAGAPNVATAPPPAPDTGATAPVPARGALLAEPPSAESAGAPAPATGRAAPAPSEPAVAPAADAQALRAAAAPSEQAATPPGDASATSESATSGARAAAPPSTMPPPADDGAAARARDATPPPTMPHTSDHRATAAAPDVDAAPSHEPSAAPAPSARVPSDPTSARAPAGAPPPAETERGSAARAETERVPPAGTEAPAAAPTTPPPPPGESVPAPAGDPASSWKPLVATSPRGEADATAPPSKDGEATGAPLAGVIDGCRRARDHWALAADTLRQRMDTLAQCLDAETYACRKNAEALAPAITDLEWAEQRVEASCPR